jgi:HAD superfamily hydrolase (TIGR01549 family)
MADVKLITFDLDNTLWDVDSVIRKAETSLRAWMLNEVPDVVANYSPEIMSELRSQVLVERPEWRHDLSRLREELMYRAIRRSGYGEREARRHASHAFAVFLEARHDVEFFDGALDVLEVLARDFVLGALTNGNADFRKLQLDRFFSFGYSAATVGVGKPAPDIFHAALRHASARPPEAIHVGDHLEDDIRGASEVGLHTIWVNLKREPRPDGSTEPTHTVHQVDHVTRAVQDILASL